MKTESKTCPFPASQVKKWDALIRNRDIDEMALLDLLFVEEMLLPSKRGRHVAGGKKMRRV